MIGIRGVIKKISMITINNQILKIEVEFKKIQVHHTSSLFATKVGV